MSLGNFVSIVRSTLLLHLFLFFADLGTSQQMSKWRKHIFFQLVYQYKHYRIIHTYMNMGSMEYMDTLHYISCIFVDISDNHLLFFAMQKNLYSTLGFIGVWYNDQLIKSCCCTYMSDAKRLQPGTQEVIVCLEKKLYQTESTTKASFSRNYKNKS